MTNEESLELLLLRWSAVEEVVARYRREAAVEVLRENLVVFLSCLSAERTTVGAMPRRDPYLFRLDFADYDDHAARIFLCDPANRATIGSGKQFYPSIADNSVFSHETFLCMPGERRCYEQGNHPEWRGKQHYHPEVVIGSLLELIRSPTYRGPA